VSGFQHDIAGGGGDLIITSVQSPDYSPGSAGWQIRKDGSAEFNNLTIRGTFHGTDFIITSTGMFFYTGTPALGNLSVSIVPGSAAVTDPEGNTAQPGVASYGATFGTAQLNSGELVFFTAAMYLAAFIVLDNAQAQLLLSSGQNTNTDVAAEVAVGSQSSTGVTGGFIQLIAGKVGLGTSGNAFWDDIAQQFQAAALTVTGNAVINGTLSVNGSTQTGTGLPAGVPTGGPNGTGFFNTTGLASGSYGSTHQHTLPNFPTAAHTHFFDGHTHQL